MIVLPCLSESLSTEVFLSHEGYWKRDLTDRGCCCSRDYALEWSPTGVHCGCRQTHLVECLQEQDVQRATSIDEVSVELYIVDDGLVMRGYRPGFGTKFGWSLWSKVMGTSNHFRYSEVVGETTMTSRAMSFCFVLDS
jgi:hypothetical protein